MYKLLLVSDKEEIRALYRGYSEWENLGFEQPTIAENAQKGIELLGRNRFDAISCLLSVNEGKKFFAYLSKRPEMLGMETARDEERLRKEISAARRTLSARDASRQNKMVDDYTRALQGEFLCDLLRGAAYDRTKIDERMQALKTMPLALQTMSGGAGVVARAGTVGAATFLTTLPSILVFAIMRGKVMETMSYSGIKS